LYEEIPTPENAPLWAYLRIVESFYRDDELDVAMQAAQDSFKKRGWLEGSWTDFFNTLTCEKDARDASIRHRVDDNLTIELSRDASEQMYENLKEAALRARALVQDALGFEFVRPIIITIFLPDAPLPYISSRYGYVSHKTHVEKICLPWDVAWSSSVSPVALVHEFTHIAEYQLALGNSIPQWLSEGLSVYVSHEARTDRCKRLAESDKKYEHLFSTDRMNGVLSSRDLRKDDPALVSAAYEFAGNLVMWWVERKGIKSVREAFKRISEGQSTERAISAAMGMSIGRMEHEWRESVMAGESGSRT